MNKNIEKMPTTFGRINKINHELNRNRRYGRNATNIRDRRHRGHTKSKIRKQHKGQIRSVIRILSNGPNRYKRICIHDVEWGI